MRCFSLGVVAAAFGLLAACNAGTVERPADEGVDEADQTSFRAPPEGSCAAKAMLAAANEDAVEALDAADGLSRSVAESLVAARPIVTLAALDAVSRVGPATLSAIFRLAASEGRMSACSPEPVDPPSGGSEIGIISDLDDTVIPHADPDMSLAPFPGVRALYQLLEHHAGGAAGDVYYVTARNPARAAGAPAYLAQHDVPAGPIETGTSGAPFIAQPEKVRDHEAILERTGQQRFILFGDTKHVDPEVQSELLAAHPERIIAGIVHDVKAIPASRVAGLHLVANYAEAAAVLFGLQVITRAEALEVMRTAHEEGLAITEAQMRSLLDAPP